VLEEMRKNPPVKWNKPAYPNYHRPGATGAGQWEDRVKIQK